MRKSRFNNSQRKAIPGQQDSGSAVRLNGTLCKECLNLNWFYSPEEVNDLLGKWYRK